MAKILLWELDVGAAGGAVAHTFQLFAGIVSDAAAKKGFEKQEIYSCRQNLVQPVPDPNYTVRA